MFSLLLVTDLGKKIIECSLADSVVCLTAENEINTKDLWNTYTLF